MAVEGIQNEFAWSRTRAACFDECPRRYWFQYYGHWGGWEAGAPPRTRQIYVLKQLKTRWMWVGDIVHQAIERAIKGLHRGHSYAEGETATWALEKMRAEFRASREGQYRDRPKRVTGLFEHEYGLPVTDAEWREAADHMRHCVSGFFQSPYLARFSALSASAWLPLEELDSFVLEGVKVFVKLDAVFRRSGTEIEIVDWKTGRDEEPDPLQLACYAAYAVEKRWVETPEQVMTVEYNVAVGRAHESRMTAERLDHVRGEISASLARMRDLLDDPRRNLASEEKFPVTDQARACGLCNFRKVCPEAPIHQTGSSVATGGAERVPPGTTA